MANTQPLTKFAQNDGEVRDQDELVIREDSNTRDSISPKKALSKREIMEQLSRERFPWDE